MMVRTSVAATMVAALAVAYGDTNRFPLESLPVRCEKAVTVEGRDPSLLPAGRKLSLVWHDEFDGDRLDESKWSYRTNFWGQRAHWFAAPEDNSVEVKDGLLKMKLVKRADGQFVSPSCVFFELK